MCGGVYAGVPVRRVGEFLDVMEKRREALEDTRRKTDRFDDVWSGFGKMYLFKEI